MISSHGGAYFENANQPQWFENVFRPYCFTQRFVPGGPAVGRPRSRTHEQNIATLGPEWIAQHMPHLRDNNGKTFPMPGQRSAVPIEPRWEKKLNGFMEIPTIKAKGSRGPRRSASSTDWKEVFDRVEHKSKMAALTPIYDRGGARTPVLKKTRFPSPRIKMPFTQNSGVGTVGHVLGLLPNRTMQSWKTTNNSEYQNGDIDEAVVELQKAHRPPERFFSHYVHKARCLQVDLNAAGHIYADMPQYGDP